MILRFILMLPNLWNGCFRTPCTCLFIALLIPALVYAFRWVVKFIDSIALGAPMCTTHGKNKWTGCIWIYFKADYQEKFQTFYPLYLRRIVYHISNENCKEYPFEFWPVCFIYIFPGIFYCKKIFWDIYKDILCTYSSFS